MAICNSVLIFIKCKSAFNEQEKVLVGAFSEECVSRNSVETLAGGMVTPHKLFNCPHLLVLVVGLRGVVPPPAPAHLILRVGAAAGLARHLGLWPRTCADIYPRHKAALGLI